MLAFLMVLTDLHFFACIQQVFSLLYSITGSHAISPCGPQQPNLKSELSLQASISSVSLKIICVRCSTLIGH